MEALRSSPDPDWSIQIAPNIRLHIWTVDNDVVDCSLQQLTPIVSLRIVLSGEARYIFRQCKEIDIRGPSLCVMVPSERCPTVQLFGQRSRLHVVGIDFYGDPSRAIWPVRLPELIAGFRCCHSRECPILSRCIAHEPLAAVAAQIVTCPFQGISRELYLTGTAFQLIALVIEFMTAHAEGRIKTSLLSPRDLERINQVKCILRNQCQCPPSREILARSVGIGPKRLTTLFRQECGIGITDFLQRYRLEQAFKLLTHTDLQIAEVAYRVGYSAAHLSTAFKKHFGRQPNELRSLGN